MLCSFFLAIFFQQAGNPLNKWKLFMLLDGFAVRLKKTAEKKLHNGNKNVLDYCKIQTCTYISFAAIYGLTAIDNILVAG